MVCTLSTQTPNERFVPFAGCDLSPILSAVLTKQVLRGETVTTRRNSDRASGLRRRLTGIALATFAFGSAALAVYSQPSNAQSVRTIQIDGDAVLAGRAMDARFDKVLRAVNQYAYVVVNPANGPEALDGLDLDADGYAGPNPNVEDFVLRAKRLGATSNTKILGYLPKSRGNGVAVDYRRIAVDGVFLAGYSCVEATAAIATIATAWPGVVIVIGTPGCSGGAASVDTNNAAQYTLTDASASNVPPGSLDPYGSYPTAPSPKLGIPAYFTDSASWDRLLVGIADVGAITINGSDLAVIRAKVQTARTGGAKIYVYVPTGYLTKNPTNASLASSRIATAIADPDVDGVFLDEVRSGCSDKAISDYTAMYNQVIAVGKALVYNPGQTAGSCFNGISTASVNFEGTASSYLNWPASEWGRNLGQNTIWQIIHSAGSADIPAIAILAKQRNAGLIWIAPSDQWAFFPDSTYFNAVRSAVRGGLTSGSTSTTSTSPAASSTTSTTLASNTTTTTTTTTGVASSTTIAILNTVSTTTTTSPSGQPTTTSATSTTKPPAAAAAPAPATTLVPAPANGNVQGAQLTASNGPIPIAPPAKAVITKAINFTG